MMPAIQPVAELRNFTGARLVAANDDRMAAAELQNSDELERHKQCAAKELQRQGGVL